MIETAATATITTHRKTACSEMRIALAESICFQRSGARPATAEEFAAFESEHGPFLPPDGEG